MEDGVAGGRERTDTPRTISWEMLVKCESAPPSTGRLEFCAEFCARRGPKLQIGTPLTRNRFLAEILTFKEVTCFSGTLLTSTSSFKGNPGGWFQSSSRLSLLFELNAFEMKQTE